MRVLPAGLLRFILFLTAEKIFSSDYRAGGDLVECPRSLFHVESSE